jgi:DNA replication licensing factor MCM4
VPLFDVVINAIKDDVYRDEDVEEKRITVHPFNLRKKHNMRELNPINLDSLVAVKGMIIRVGGIIPEMKIAFFQCDVCNDVQEVQIEDGNIAQPSQCANCDQKHSYKLIHNRSEFSDMQLLKVQVC